MIFFYSYNTENYSVQENVSWFTLNVKYTIDFSELQKVILYKSVKANYVQEANYLMLV